MIKRIWIISLVLLFYSLHSFAADKAIILDINGYIGPATQDYVQRGLALAKNQKASIIILKLNTPGGLETSMRGISQAIMNSSIPFVAFVAPPGSRAASAGTFIVYASHLAAMAKGTNIGAASPVRLFHASSESHKLSTSEQKAVNDAIAYIRSMAQQHGRNADWAEQAVRASATLSSADAKRLHVINEIADNVPELLKKINNQAVTVKDKAQKIKTDQLELVKVSPDWRYEFLSFITNPNIAYILMLIAIYGIFFEMSNPGLILPGVAGIIALLLLLYSFQLMPINYTGLTLVLIGIVFIIFEVYVSSFGIVGLGGIIAFIIGSIMLYDIQDPQYRLALTLILIMCMVTVTFFFLVLMMAVKSQKKKIVTGEEGLIGTQGKVLSTANNKILVRVLGEIWEAQSSTPLHTGDSIKVTQIKGLTLMVEPLQSKHQ